MEIGYKNLGYFFLILLGLVFLDFFKRDPKIFCVNDHR